MKRPISYTANNAAKKDTFVGMLYEKGVQQTKNEILTQIELDARRLYEEGYIHIHDLEAYGLTYNCLSLDVLNSAKINMCNTGNDFEKILNIVEYYKEIISNIGNEQSGGISFANFDYEISTLFSRFDIADSEENLNLLALSLIKFLNWINKTRTRYGEEHYYVTLNMGLDTTTVGRHVIQVIINELSESDFMLRPNIVMKVKKGINVSLSDANYDVLQQAIQCSCKRMNPTYLNCDSESFSECEGMKLSIMGCRTNVSSNLFGDTTSIGRGNIANISINLPRIAFEIVENKTVSVDERFNYFQKKWEELADKVSLILLDRYKKTCRQDINLFPANKEYQLWSTPFEKDLVETFKNGTLSVGFIGLSEAVEILFDKKIYEDENLWRQTIDFVKFMRKKMNQNTNYYNLNFSLLATSGEGISSRFLDIDKELYSHTCLEKGYYTNSFHIEVDSNVSAFRKLELEGPYHKYCNGGSISYVELGEAPIHNPNALSSILKYAIENNVNYLGFNFPLDICKQCGHEGFYNSCPNCGSSDIYRIRRVSGYLEMLDNFGKGKLNEENNRRKNHFGA